MPSVQFHILPEPDKPAVYLEACSFLAEKFHTLVKQSHLIVLCNPEDLRFFDDRFWNFIPQSFLPHQVNSIIPSEGMIDLLSSPKEIPIETHIPNVLMNFSNFPILPNHPAFNSLLAMHIIVGKDSQYREFCRTLFREYKKHGIQILTKNVVS
jgi:DNA polymerase IIIc chi subunit